MKIQTRIYSRKLPESIQNAISFDVIQFKNFKLFMENPSLVVILCFRQWHVFQKWGVFQRYKGRGHEKFSRGQAPGPPFFLPSLAPRFSSPPPPISISFRRACLWRCTGPNLKYQASYEIPMALHLSKITFCLSSKRLTQSI